MRSACLSWPLSERPASSICALRPCAPRLVGELERGALRLRRASASATNRSTELARDRQLAGGQQHPLDPRRPARGRRRRAAELLDQAVVAAAAADARLRAERVGGELEHGPRVVVEAAHERRIELVAEARHRRAARARAVKCSASSGASRSSSVGASLIVSRVRGVAGVERAHRVQVDPRARPRARVRPHARAGRRSAPRGTRRGSAGVPRLESRRRTLTRRRRAWSRSASSRISSASVSGVGGADRLGADLPELAVAPASGAPRRGRSSTGTRA